MNDLFAYVVNETTIYVEVEGDHNAEYVIKVCNKAKDLNGDIIKHRFGDVVVVVLVMTRGEILRWYYDYKDGVNFSNSIDLVRDFVEKQLRLVVGGFDDISVVRLEE